MQTHKGHTKHIVDTIVATIGGDTRSLKLNAQHSFNIAQQQTTGVAAASTPVKGSARCMDI